ncbi:MAG: prolipoprotein diacylglyceryl transferase [Sarcina sp.]
MKPILFEIFGFKVYGYGFMIAIGILLAIMLFIKKMKSKGYNEDKAYNMIFISIAAGILGGKILYIITDFNYVMENPKVIIENFGYGFVIYGAILAGMLAIYLYSKKSKWNPLEIFDFVAPVVALAQGFGRIGCLFAGCCYGAVTSSPIYIEFPVGSLAPAAIHLHPTQIYSTIFDFSLAIFLLWYQNNKSKVQGEVFSLYLIIYSIGRILVELLRNDPRGAVGFLSTSQFISIFILISGVIILKQRHRKREN